MGLASKIERMEFGKKCIYKVRVRLKLGMNEGNDKRDERRSGERIRLNGTLD